jgi:hypothetical protein
MKDCYKPEELVKKLDEAEKRVQQALAAVDANAARDHKHHVERLRSAIRQRAKIVTTQLANYEASVGKPIDAEGFIRYWLVLAPIPHPPGVDANQAPDKELVKDEARFEPKEGDKVKVGNKEFVWKKVQIDDYFIDFSTVSGAADNSTAYAVAYVVAPNEMKDVVLRIGSDDSAKAFINGKEVGKVIASRGVGKDQDAFAGITLKKGVNVLVLKVSNGTSAWGGAARFVDKSGNLIKGLNAQFTK